MRLLCQPFCGILLQNSKKGARLVLTIYDWFGYELPVRERYRLIREAGFAGSRTRRNGSA